VSADLRFFRVPLCRFGLLFRGLGVALVRFVAPLSRVQVALAQTLEFLLQLGEFLVRAVFPGR
jgi:hypothetical protein